jgi:hypothetical protein
LPFHIGRSAYAGIEDHVGMRAASLICAVVARVACAWFGLGAHQAIDSSRAAAIVAEGGRISPAASRRAVALARGADTLNPDREVDILRAAALLERGDGAGARQILTSVTRAEPQNLEAWLWLARASAGDPKLVLAALRRVRALEPRLPPR